MAKAPHTSLHRVQTTERLELGDHCVIVAGIIAYLTQYLSESLMSSCARTRQCYARHTLVSIPSSLRHRVNSEARYAPVCPCFSLIKRKRDEKCKQVNTYDTSTHLMKSRIKWTTFPSTTRCTVTPRNESTLGDVHPSKPRWRRPG